MFHATSLYLVLDSLVPPIDEELISQESPLRLQTLCALIIARSKNNCHLLSNTPTHLHKIVWAAYLRDEYYAHRDSIDSEVDIPIEETELFLDVIPELLYHWPHKEFALNELMPAFPPRPKRFSHFWGWSDGIGPYYQNYCYLLQFYDFVVNAIVRCCIDNNGRFPEQHKNYGTIRKINVSGFNVFRFTDMAYLTGITDPFYKNKDGKLEIMLDVELNCENIETLENWFTHCYSKSTDYFIIKIGMITIQNTDKTEEVTRIMTKIVNEGAFSITLDNVEGSVLIDKVFENANQKNILAVDLDGCVTSLNIMLFFVNLIQLDLSNNDLHDQLNFLMHMHKGLLSLKMSNCNLKNKDLDKLTRSCHQSTLRELYLNDNTFEYDDNSEYLNRLCEALTNVLQLDLKSCGLESWPCDVIQLLFKSFTMLPNIIYLCLCNNYFSMDTITKHIMILRESSSLRYLHLSLPLEFTEDQMENDIDLIKSFNGEINAKMNKRRSQLMYVELC